MGLWDILIIFFVLSALLPVLARRRLQMARANLLRRIQGKEGSRVIVLIHRQETVSFLGIPLQRYIDIEDSEEILRAIRKIGDDTPIDLVLHTPGGLVVAAEQIALALAADEIMMDPNAVLGPIDPQLGNCPAASVLEVVRQKGAERVEDKTLMYADLAYKAVIQVRHNAERLLRRNYPEREAARIAATLTEGRWTHDYPLHVDELEAIGIAITVGLPEEIYDLMELYPQPTQRRPSVQYINPPETGEQSGRGRGD